MRLLISIVTSLICGTAMTAVLYRYVAENAAAPGFWDNDVFATLWMGFGGVGGILMVAYGLFAFALVTSYAYLDLGLVRTRLVRLGAASAEPPERHWHAAFADTDFRTLAGQITPYELGGAPLSLLRLLRTEIWRIYAKRILCAATVAVALAAALLALAPVAPAPPLSAAAAHWRMLAAVLVVAAAAAIWVAMDNAIGRLAMTMTRLATAWAEAPSEAVEPLAERRAVAPLALAPPAPDALSGLFDRLANELARGSGAAPEAAEMIGTAVAALQDALAQSAAAQRAMLERLEAGLAAQGEALLRAVEAARPAEADIAALGAALTELAAAVDKLADPVLRRMQLLGATDRRLLAVLRRQENAVGSVTTRWGELVTALQAMSAGLDGFAQVAARHGPAAAPPAPAGGVPELTDELQELLDEISTAAPGSMARPRVEKP